MVQALRMASQGYSFYSPASISRSAASWSHGSVVIPELEKPDDPARAGGAGAGEGCTDFRIEARLNISSAVGHEHRIHPIAARAAALFSERLEHRWQWGFGDGYCVTRSPGGFADGST